MVALVLVVALAGLLSSPDVPPVTLASWAKVAPADFVGTAASELAGTSETATYGPPYNSGTPGVQRRASLPPASIAGVRQPIDAAADLRAGPAGQGRPYRPRPRPPPDRYQQRRGATQSAWDAAYLKAVTHVTFPAAPRRARRQPTVRCRSCWPPN